MSMPARSMSRMATMVASSCASSRCSSGSRHIACMRVRGTDFDSMARSTSHSGCGELPTTVVGSKCFGMFTMLLLVVVLTGARASGRAFGRGCDFVLDRIAQDADAGNLDLDHV